MGEVWKAVRVYRLNWTSGRKELFHEFRPADPTAMQNLCILVTPDGKAWVYSFYRGLPDLYLVEGVE
jgi:hypothetical protein